MRMVIHFCTALACFTSISVHAQPGSLDRTFYPGSATDGPVHAIALQEDGHCVIAGDFTIADNGVRSRIARLKPDGSLDASFGAKHPGPDAAVHSVAVQPDGKVLIGGDFANTNVLARRWFARLLPDGSLDAGFKAAIDGPVFAIAVQSDGKILIGGTFSTANGVRRRGNARLHEDGSLDETFADSLAGAPAQVYALAVETNGRVLLGGSFARTSGITRTNIARVLASGLLDTNFGGGTLVADDAVLTIVPQPNGQILIGGRFDTVNGVTRHGLARLNSNGSVDAAYDHVFNRFPSGVGSMALQSDGRLIVRGHLALSNFEVYTIARLTEEGSLDASFAGGALDVREARALALQPDGKVIVAGGSALGVGRGRMSLNGVVRHGFMRLEADGSLDLEFNRRPIGPDQEVSALLLQPDGKVIINVGRPVTASLRPAGISRLNADGSFDGTFAREITNEVFAGATSIARQSDGKIILAGSFTAVVKGIVWRNIVRLLPDGECDTNFNSGVVANNSIDQVVVQSDDKIVIGGDFSRGIARLDRNGFLDPTFTNTSVAWVECLAVQPDHKVIIGGTFEQVGTTPRNRIARLNADGTVDTTFGEGMSGANSVVYCVAVQPDGKIVLGGGFTMVNGARRYGIARLNTNGTLDTGFDAGPAGVGGTVLAIALQPDGKIVIGGGFVAHCLERLKADGSLDTTFLTTGLNSTVHALAIGGDGRIVVGGAFTAFDSLGLRYVARLHGDRPPLTISRSGADTVRLSWPASWSSFAAQETANLNSGWGNVEPAMSNDGTNMVITIPPGGANRFYRLTSGNR